MSNFFHDWIFSQFPKYHQMNDTNIDGSGDGSLKRYLRVFGIELDTNFQPYIDNFTVLTDVINCDDKFLPLLGSILGYPPSIDGTNSTYRKILAYAVSIYKVKGTLKSFQILFNLLGLSITIIEQIPNKKVTYDVGALYDDGNFYDSECDNCSGYWIQYNGNVTLTTDQLAAVTNIINFINPINATFLGMLKTQDISDSLTMALNDVSNLCGIPINIYGVFNTSTNSANIYWANTSGNFQLQYRQKGVGSYSSPVTAASGYNITGLTAGDIYEVQIRQQCSDGSFSPWVTLLLFSEAGLIDSGGFNMFPTSIEYIANSPIINILTDYSFVYGFDVPIILNSILIDGVWLTPGLLLPNKASFVTYLNSLGFGTFVLDVNGDPVLTGSTHVFSKIVYRYPTDLATTEIDFFQYGQRIPTYPGLILSDYRITLDFTNPIQISSIRVNGIDTAMPSTVLTTQAGAITYLNAQSIGTFSADGDDIISVGNSNGLSLLTYNPNGDTTNYGIYFVQRNIRITGGTKLLLTDYSISLPVPINITDILVNGTTYSGGTFTTTTDLLTWLNGLGFGTWTIDINNIINSIGNQNTISQITYNDGSSSIDILFTQLNQRIQNFDGTTTTYVFSGGTEITDGNILLYNIPAGIYDKLTIYFSNPVTITGGQMVTTGYGPYTGFVDSGNLVFIGVQVGAFTQISIY